MRKLSALTLSALLVGQSTAAWADPPAGRGNGIGAAGSTLQRAVDSRAGLQQRAGLRAQGSATAGTGVGVGGNGTGQNSANANGNLGVNASVQTEANGNASAQSGTGRLPREVVVRRLQALRSQQSAMIQQANRANVDLRIGNNNEAPSDQPAPANNKSNPKNKSPRGKSGEANQPGSNSNENSNSPNGLGVLSLNGSSRSEIVAHGQNRLAWTNADRIFAQRLARIDQMRDQAIESGNDQMLDQADRLELSARTQYAERLAADANDSSSQAGAGAQGQATGAIRGGLNRANSQNTNPGAPSDSVPGQDTNDLSGQANAAAQNSTGATLSNGARRATDRTRGDATSSETTRRTRNASFSGQSNATGAANATSRNNSLDAAGSSATNAAGSATSK